MMSVDTRTTVGRWVLGTHHVERVRYLGHPVEVKRARVVAQPTRSFTNKKGRTLGPLVRK